MNKEDIEKIAKFNLLEDDIPKDCNRPRLEKINSRMALLWQSTYPNSDIDCNNEALKITEFGDCIILNTRDGKVKIARGYENLKILINHLNDIAEYLYDDWMFPEKKLWDKKFKELSEVNYGDN